MSHIHDIAYYRQRTQNRVWEAVVHALERANAIDGTRKKDVAEFLGVPRSQVSRWLSGPSNWGIDTMSDLLLSAGAEMDFSPVRFEDRVPQNEHHDLNAQWPTTMSEVSAGSSATSVSASFKIIPAHAEV